MDSHPVPHEAAEVYEISPIWEDIESVMRKPHTCTDHQDGAGRAKAPKGKGKGALSMQATPLTLAQLKEASKLPPYDLVFQGF